MSRLELMSGLELLHFFRATAEADRLVLRTFYRSLRDSIATSAIQLYYGASRRGRAPHPGIWIVDVWFAKLALSSTGNVTANSSAEESTEQYGCRSVA
jgi:hypothetical protein